ncbi:MAG: SpoIIE family protein phosphatase [Lentisphaerae bacterium]|nr:SpoIIE family protein phosphatase [Lentisphaerota bacterium]
MTPGFMDAGFGSTAWLGVAGVCVVMALCFLRSRRMIRQRDALLQEKDVAYNFMHDVSEAFSGAGSTQVDFLLQRVLYYAMQTAKAGGGAIYFAEHEGDLLCARAIEGLFPPIVDGLDAEFEQAKSRFHHLEQLVRNQKCRWGEGLVGRVAQSGAALLIEDAERDSRVLRFAQDFLTIRSILLVPLRFQNNVLGVLAVVNRIDDSPFIQTDLNLLQALADQASVTLYFAKFNEALEEKKLMDYDLRLARRIQDTLLPRQVPEVEGIELAAFSLPAREVGGDYYDFVMIDPDHLGITIADVSGKGVSGAIMMSVCRSVFRASAHGCLSPSHVLKTINRVLAQDIYEDMFISMLYLVLNIRTFKMIAARAGHPKPFMILSPSGSLAPLESRGMAIGMADTETFDACLDETVVNVEAGSSLAVYTDGVIEAMNRNKEEWGIERLQAVVRNHGREGARNTIRNVRQEITEFVGQVPQYDDMTLIVLHRAG